MYSVYTYIPWIYIYTYTYCGGRMCKLFTLLLLRSSLFGSGENGVGKRLMVDGVGCFWVECQFLSVYWFQARTLNVVFDCGKWRSKKAYGILFQFVSGVSATKHGPLLQFSLWFAAWCEVGRWSWSLRRRTWSLACWWENAGVRAWQGRPLAASLMMFLPVLASPESMPLFLAF